MNTPFTLSRPQTKTAELTKIAIVAGLYVAVTLLVAPFGFGAIQFRLSEMFNFLALHHKRYVYAVTLGVAISNFLMSPIWVIDVPVGTLSTFVFLLLCRYLTKNILSKIKKYVIMTVVISISMFTIAAQLSIMLSLPFWETWLTVGVSEFLTMIVGGVLIYTVSKKIDFSK